jgi:hypothetical protein
MKLKGQDVTDRHKAKMLEKAKNQEEQELTKREELENKTKGSGLVWSGLVWSGLVWSGLVWSGLVWSGLVWSGPVRSGLVWSGLVRDLEWDKEVITLFNI